MHYRRTVSLLSTTAKTSFTDTRTNVTDASATATSAAADGARILNVLCTA